MYCKNCGSYNEDTNCYCKDCGAKLVDNEKNSKKKIGVFIGIITTIILLVILVIVVFLVRNNTENGKKADSANGENSDRTTNGDTLEIEELDGRVIISKAVQMYLANDGTVWGKGRNEEGELGNGERVDSNEWTKVQNLENVIGIYAIDSYGNTGVGGNDRHAFAVTKDGDLYWWGNNILVPEQIILDSPVASMHSYGDIIQISCENGKNYVIKNESWKESVYSYDSMLENARLIECCEVTQKQAYYLKSLGGALQTLEESLDSRNHLTECPKLEDYIEKIEIDIGNNEILTCNYCFPYVCIVSEEGKVLEADISILNEDGIIQCTNRGGEGYRKYLKCGEKLPTYFHLFQDGTMQTSGQNGNGILGDGTNLDYYEGVLTLDEAKFKDFLYLSTMVVTLDSENNIWVWGEGFTSSPEILVSEEMFMNGPLE